jgi:hypothetical protein
MREDLHCLHIRIARLNQSAQVAGPDQVPKPCTYGEPAERFLSMASQSARSGRRISSRISATLCVSTMLVLQQEAPHYLDEPVHRAIFYLGITILSHGSSLQQLVL